MKNQFNDTQNVDAFVSQGHDMLGKKALIDAVNLAEASANAQALENYERGIRSAYAKILLQVKNELQAASARISGKVAKATAETQVEEIETKISENKETIRLAIAERRLLSIDYPWQHYLKFLAIEIAMIAGEGLMNSYVFALFGGALLFSFFASLIFAIALAVVAYVIPKHIVEYSANKRTGLWVRFVSVMTAVFLCIGLLRSIVAGGGTMLSITLSIVPFAIIFAVVNLFVFFATVALSSFLPNRRQFVDKRKYDDLSRLISQKEAGNISLEKDKAKILTSTREELQKHMNAIDRDAYFEQMLSAMAEETIAAFYTQFNIYWKSAKSSAKETKLIN